MCKVCADFGGSGGHKPRFWVSPFSATLEVDEMQLSWDVTARGAYDQRRSKSSESGWCSACV